MQTDKLQSKKNHKFSLAQKVITLFNYHKQTAGM